MENFSHAVDAAPVAIAMVDARGTILYVNVMAERLLGYSRAELMGQPVECLLPEELRDRHRHSVQGFVRAPEPRVMSGGRELRARRRDGTVIPVEIGLGYLEVSTGVVSVVTILDVSSRSEAERLRAEALSTYKAVFEQVRDGIGVIQDGRFVLANETLASMADHHAEDIYTIPFVSLLTDDYAAAVGERYQERMAADVEPPARTEARVRKRSGEPGPWVEINAKRISYQGRAAALVVLRDVTEQRERTQRLAQLAGTDSLTGLPNRSHFRDRLEQAIRTARRLHTRCAVLYIDLDGFKPINDLYGHAAGDTALRTVARRLQDRVRGMDIAARLGGDEFVIALTDIVDVTQVTALAERLLRAVTEPIDIGTHHARVWASIGIAVFPDDARDSETLISRADEALYRVKASGGNRFFVAGQRSVGEESR